VNEIISLVNVALGSGVLANCEAGDGNGDQQITIDEIVTAVNNALGGCQPAAEQPQAVLRQGPGGFSNHGTVRQRPAPKVAAERTRQPRAESKLRG